MHPVANEVEVPTDQVERYLLQWAKPGYTGQREIYLRVRPEAGLQVEFIPTGNEVEKVGRQPTISPPLFKDEPTERQLTVGAMIVQNRHRFRIGVRLARITAHFNDGRLVQLEWGTVG